jgi:hypothetical protein
LVKVQTKKRPMTVTILGWLYVGVGALSTAAHLADFRAHQFTVNEFAWISALGAAAVLAGAFMLRGHNWARWLALAWIASHVVISAYHPPHELVMHCALLVLFSYLLLFRLESRNYFNAA